MRRESKKRSLEKGYYKRNPCKEVFTCKVCGRLVTPEGAGSGHRNHCPNCLTSLHLDVEPGDRAADCGGCGCARAASGPLSTGAAGAGHSAPIGWRRTTTL